MEIGLIFFSAWIVFMAITVIAFIAWFFREGQHKNIEEAKYRMLEDHEPEAWPGRANPKVINTDQLKTVRKD
jgi:cbb3-type cytochrome oxidase subunit 3